MPIPLPPYRSLLAKYLKPQKRQVVGLAITLLSSIALQIINPQILGYFIDTAVKGGSQQTLLLAAAGFTAIACLTQVFSVTATYLGASFRAVGAYREWQKHDCPFTSEVV